MATTNKTMTIFEWALLLTLSILWGGSFFFVGIAVNDLPPFTIVALRVGLAAISLAVIVIITGSRMPTCKSAWGAFFIMGLLNNVFPFSLIVWGQAYIASGVASILNATTPLFTVLAAHILTRDEKITTSRLLGVFAGFVGVVLMIGPDALGSAADAFSPQLAVLAASFSYALAGIFGRRFQRMGITPLATATGQVTASSIILVPLAITVDHPWNLAVPGWEVCGAVAALALFSTTLAYVIYFRILSTAGATNVLLVTLLVPVSAVLLGTTFLSEQLEAKHLAGMGLITLGLAAIDGRLFRMLHTSLSTHYAKISRDSNNQK